ncbi:single-stranded DNA-binding protein [Cytobacillus purgationiresistens]|uniref:Single-stranded DNA-binding protein n=1 Tax=Cytobacillus purgationiresistens TaxID=863449 RepID=A0ABU0AER2_9BACI|nr:single-stranded DNA-binding protein [Cytobacillus purgationiresistens]MDQ0269226.1 single-strand DNA-binding protein [Cytobacillus purgationiresistens]
MINQVTLVGRLTRDPELKRTQDGKAVTNVTLAVNRQFKNQDGEIEADFVQCTLWRKTAENLIQYCQKGSLIGITGRIQTRSYDSSDKKRIYVTEVVAEQVRFLEKKRTEALVPALSREEMRQVEGENSRREGNRMHAGESNQNAW